MTGLAHQRSVPVRPAGTSRSRSATRPAFRRSATGSAITWRFATSCCGRRPGETQLAGWQPGAQGDLAVQMVEWWAYLADILTFYNERIANESYLGTAILPESVNHLVQLLGYRPRPALGAKVTLAGLLAAGARVPVALPAGHAGAEQARSGRERRKCSNSTPRASCNRPTSSPPTLFRRTGSCSPTPPRRTRPTRCGSPARSRGSKSRDRLLLINAKALAVAPSIADYAWITVTAVQPATSPLGDAVTAVSFTPVASTLTANAQAADYVLLRGGQSSPLWGFPTTTASLTVSGVVFEREASRRVALPPTATIATINLAGLARSLTPGGLFLLDAAQASGLTPVPAIVKTYSEQFWYANCGANADASAPPASNTPPPVGIPISTLTAGGVPAAWGGHD